MSYFALFIFLFQMSQPAIVTDLPNSPGVYYRQADKNWIALQKAPVSRTKTKGLDLFAETGGYTNLGVDVVCEGAKASTRIPAPKPRFYVRGLEPSEDVTLVRLSQKENSRTFHISSGNANVENKQGFRKADIRKVVVSKYPDGIFSVTPESDLRPGEYLLVIGSPENSFDFGIDRKK